VSLIRKTIELLGKSELGEFSAGASEKEVKKIFDGTRRQIISVRLSSGARLQKHKAREPIF
jgi:hypothetical protein